MYSHPSGPRRAGGEAHVMLSTPHTEELAHARTHARTHLCKALSGAHLVDELERRPVPAMRGRAQRQGGRADPHVRAQPGPPPDSILGSLCLQLCRALSRRCALSLGSLAPGGLLPGLLEGLQAGVGAWAPTRSYTPTHKHQHRPMPTPLQTHTA